MSSYEQYRKKGGEYIIPVEVFEELLEENEELKAKINTYKNPDDLTLMFMYCDEKAKDKIKELQNKIHTLEDELNWYKQECDDLEMRIELDE